MGTFRHSADNSIYINTTYIPLSFFVTLEPAYALPVGYIGRYYEQTVKNVLYTSTNAVGDTMPYTAGDGYITNEAAYAAAYAAYIAPTVSLAQAKVTRIYEMTTYAISIKYGAITVAGYIYPSDTTSAQDRLHQFEAYTRAAALPAGFYLNDVNHAQVTPAGISDLSAISDAIVGLHHLVDNAADIHRTAINALGSVSAVQAYDFTGGWPPIPGVSTVSFYATYAANINGTRGGGVLAGTAFGGAAVAATYLDLAHNDARYVTYAAHLNADFQQQQVITFYLVPNYNNAPAATQVFACISKADTDADNLVQLSHNADGHLYLTMNDAAGVLIANADFGIWNPVLGTEYYIVCSHNLTAGDNRLYIDWAQKGSTNTATGTRDASIALLRVGSGYNSGAAETSNFAIRELVIFHTT
ncbi:MAG: hypothetical protein WC495_03745 [Patescibacteria group bacterium]